MSFAKVIAVGRIGAEPELRHTATGRPTCNFPVALTRHYRDHEGNSIEQTDWERVVTFGRLAENVAQYCSKGRRIYVTGYLQTRSYEPEEGHRRWITEIVADQVEFLDSPKSSSCSPALAVLAETLEETEVLTTD